MKLGKMAVLTAAAAIVCVCAGYRSGFAKGESQIGPAKVAVVDVSRVLQNSARHKQWQSKMQDEETQMKAEYQRLRKELDALKANLDLLKPGSADYLKTMGDYLDKQGQTDARNKYYEEKVNAEMQRWTESLYTQLLDIIGKTAQRKGIDLVLAQEQLDLPAVSLRDFMLTIRTKKVLYNGGGLDITDEVLAELDKPQDKTQ